MKPFWEGYFAAPIQCHGLSLKQLWCLAPFPVMEVAVLVHLRSLSLGVVGEEQFQEVWVLEAVGVEA